MINISVSYSYITNHPPKSSGFKQPHVIFLHVYELFGQFFGIGMVLVEQLFWSCWDSGDQGSVSESTIVLAEPTSSASHVSSSSSLGQACFCKYFYKALFT